MGQRVRGKIQRIRRRRNLQASFALTSPHFSFFNMDKRLLSIGRGAVRIRLKDIKRCDVYEKLATYRIELTLKESEVLEITGPCDFLAAYIQEVTEQESCDRQGAPTDRGFVALEGT